MTDLTDLLRNWWKQMLLLVLLTAVSTAVLLFTRPVMYLSVSTAIPASTYTSDKARFFNQQIQQLYPGIGTPDDLDFMVGTGNLDTLYLAVADALQLQNHYRVKENGNPAREKAALLLKKNSRISKSGFGELRIKVWDRDAATAARMANALQEAMEQMHQRLRNAGNEAALAGLYKSRDRLSASQMAATDADSIALIAHSLASCNQLISQYKLQAESNPPALLVVEKARPALWPDRPKRMLWIGGLTVLAFLFSLLLAIFLERKKQTVAG
ncbi:MAG: hypothetical protein IAE96_06870 [Chitinophagaceae bacterium]|nr:hypothetical protein [Chitinophagaceae bacterium]